MANLEKRKNAFPTRLGSSKKPPFWVGKSEVGLPMFVPSTYEELLCFLSLVVNENTTI